MSRVQTSSGQPRVHECVKIRAIRSPPFELLDDRYKSMHPVFHRAIARDSKATPRVVRVSVRSLLITNVESHLYLQSPFHFNEMGMCLESYYLLGFLLNFCEVQGLEIHMQAPWTTFLQDVYCPPDSLNWATLVEELGNIGTLGLTGRNRKLIIDK